MCAGARGCMRMYVCVGVCGCVRAHHALTDVGGRAILNETGLALCEMPVDYGKN